MEFFKPGTFVDFMALAQATSCSDRASLVLASLVLAVLSGAELRHRLRRRHRAAARFNGRVPAARAPIDARAARLPPARRRRGRGHGQRVHRPRSTRCRRCSPSRRRPRCTTRLARGARRTSRVKCDGSRRAATRSASSFGARRSRRAQQARSRASASRVRSRQPSSAARRQPVRGAARRCRRRDRARGSSETLGDRAPGDAAARRVGRPQGGQAAARRGHQVAALRDRVHHGLRRVPLRSAVRARRRHRAGRTTSIVTLGILVFSRRR